MEAKNGIAHLGGHIALNFLNTTRMHDGCLTDTLETDLDVQSWFQEMNLPEPVLAAPLRAGELLSAARRLRSLALEAIQLRKIGKRLVPGELNRLLALSKSHLVIKQSKDRVQLTRSYVAETAEDFLAPLAEQIADLLVNGNFDLIRQCEGNTCVLWFLDQTKSHQRRWCAAESCGTRARVAAFRARKAAMDRKRR